MLQMHMPAPMYSISRAHRTHASFLKGEPAVPARLVVVPPAGAAEVVRGVVPEALEADRALVERPPRDLAFLVRRVHIYHVSTSPTVGIPSCPRRHRRGRRCPIHEHRLQLVSAQIPLVGYVLERRVAFRALRIIIPRNFQNAVPDEVAVLADLCGVAHGVGAAARGLLLDGDVVDVARRA